MENIAIILVRPQLGDNVGSSARVMKNFGITDLRLVAPTCDIPNERAEAIACHAKDIIQNVKIFPNIQSASADLNMIYATSARERNLNKDTVLPSTLEIDFSQKIGILFGPENNGLSNDEFSLATKAVYIPTSPLYHSINLAQSVGILSYEISKAHVHYKKPRTLNTVGTQENFFILYNRLISELEKRNFFMVEHMRDNMERSILNMLTKVQFSEQEIRTFHGIIRCLIKK